MEPSLVDDIIDYLMRNSSVINSPAYAFSVLEFKAEHGRLVMVQKTATTLVRPERPPKSSR